jgi:hypothetical protein
MDNRDLGEPLSSFKQNRHNSLSRLEALPLSVLAGAAPQQGRDWLVEGCIDTRRRSLYTTTTYKSPPTILCLARRKRPAGAEVKDFRAGQRAALVKFLESLWGDEGKD